jgi:hypothetical protein
MKQLKRLVLASIAAGLTVVPAVAEAPVINIVSPTGTIFVSGAGAVVPIQVTVAHSPLSILTQFDVQVDGASILPGGQVNPFTGGGTPNQCTSDLIAASAACSTNNLDLASVTVNWTVPEVPRTYTLFAKARHQNADGTDEEEVIVPLLDIEYPAPPAVANAYINSLSSSLRKLFSSGVRGCVISQIAEAHAQLSKYGPKGGPYDVPLIQSDVRAFSVGCGGPVIP